MSNDHVCTFRYPTGWVAYVLIVANAILLVLTFAIFDGIRSSQWSDILKYGVPICAILMWFYIKSSLSICAVTIEEDGLKCSWVGIVIQRISWHEVKYIMTEHPVMISAYTPKSRTIIETTRAWRSTMLDNANGRIVLLDKLDNYKRAMAALTTEAKAHDIPLYVRDDKSSPAKLGWLLDRKYQGLGDRVDELF